jgi:RHS repeat-associated protein
MAFNYAYDPAGNRWSQTIPSTCSGCTGPQPQYSFGTNNRITSASGILYDAVGNVINDGLGHTYTYDAENRMITVNGGTQAYFYDAFGRTTQTIYGGNTYSKIYGLKGRTEVQVVGTTWMLSELYIGSTGDYLGNYSNNTTYFAHNDQVGTRRRYTDASGNIVQTCTSLPFGDGLSCTGSGTQSPTSFAGQDLDPNTGLIRFPMRNYSTAQGRWMHPDPAGLAAVDPTNPQTWNRYTYVLNNPEILIDPLGLFCVWDDGSFDSNDDPDTGSQEACQGDGDGDNGAGGTWFNGDPSGWVDSNDNQIFGSNDWSGDPNSEAAALAQGINPNVGDFGDASTAANNSSTVSAGYTVNVIASFFYGLGPAFTYTKIPSLNLTCVGGGLGASAGHNFSFGPTVVSTQNAKSILSSWSFSAGYNFTPWLGGGGSANSSGAASGNTFGVPGAGAAVTWSKCWGG